MADLSSTHYQLSNALSLVSVRATKCSMAQNALSWCICTSHIASDVTFPPDFRVVHMQKFFFELRFGIYSPVAFQRAIARLCTSNKIPNVTKRSFLV